MKPLKLGLMAITIIVLMISTAIADDFSWMPDFNLKAEADPTGFRARLEARFRVGDIDIKTVLGNTRSPADAYVCLRLGEMSHRPVDDVIQHYKSNKGKGWGAMAKQLGIKPGSEEFHALKNGPDIDSGNQGGKGKGKSKRSKKK